MKGAEHNNFSKMMLFLALSRTPHGLLDICTPLLAAVLWLGHLPELETIILGTVAAFAGYTAVYALNDIVDYENDKKKINQTGFQRQSGDLDAAFVRHPLAQGYLRMSEAIAWTGGWTLISLLCAYLLNPICALILVLGCILETVYCLMLQVSHLRTLVSGIVKTLGGLAAVFAVDASPEPGLLLLLFFWLFFWEVGGQNVPNDWHDIDEDTSLDARTVPVTLGCKTASIIILASLSVSFVLSVILFQVAPLQLGLPLYLATLLIGIYLLLYPALRLFSNGMPARLRCYLTGQATIPASSFSSLPFPLPSNTRLRHTCPTAYSAKFSSEASDTGQRVGTNVECCKAEKKRDLHVEKTIRSLSDGY